MPVFYLSQVWDENDLEPRRPGVGDKQVAAWEAQHGVTLPALLRKVLRRQDGGLVCYSQVRVLPLRKMVPPDDEFWEFATCDDDEVAERRLLFKFGFDEVGQYFLNFNTNGAAGEPTVYRCFSEAELEREASCLATFLGRLLDVAEVPAVDWSETERLDEVLHQESLAFSDDRGQMQMETILGRLEGTLVVFTHEVSPDSESYTRTELPEPLQKSSASIEEFRPAPRRTYTLHLEPADTDGIVEIQSERTADGKWKNRTSHGVPVYVGVESGKKAVLQALRETLFGKNAAARADHKDRLQLDMMRKFESLTDEQQRAAGHALAEQMMAKFEAEFGAEVPPEDEIPPELLQASKTLHSQVEKIRKKIRAAQAQQPPDADVAEVADLMAELVQQDEEDEDEEEQPRRAAKKKLKKK